MRKTFKRYKTKYTKRKIMKKTYRRKNRGGMFSRLASTVARRSAPQMEQKIKGKMEEYTSDLAEAKIKQTPQYKKVKDFLDNDVTNFIGNKISNNENNSSNKENIGLNYNYPDSSQRTRVEMLVKTPYSPLNLQKISKMR